MKHIVRLTKQGPIPADEFQDIICATNEALGVLLEFKGGTSPIKEFVSDKCDLPGDLG